MSKPQITTKASKQLALTYNELDQNFINLRDSTIGFTVGSSTATIDLNSALTITAGTGIALALNTVNDTLTVSNTGVLSVTGTAGRITSTGGVNPILDLATTTVTPGSYTSATITVDAYGRITAASAGSSNSILQGNSSVTVTDSGTGQIDFTVDGIAVMQLKSTGLTRYRETVFAGGNTSASVTPNYNNGNVQLFTTSANFALNLPTNMSAGQNLVLVFTQGSPPRTITPNSNYRFVNGVKTLTPSFQAIDILSIFYDGNRYLCNLNKGYI